MNEYRKKSIFEKRKLAIEDLVKYYVELRKYNYHNGEKLKGIEIRKKIHILCDFILKIDQLLSKEDIIIIGDKHNTKSNNPRIYAIQYN